MSSACSYFGVVGMSGDSTVKCNFGGSPFVFDLKTIPREKQDLAYISILNQFKKLGNIIGLCLLHGGGDYGLTLPLFFCRHVYKFIIGRPITFADYAYFEPEYHKNFSFVRFAIC